jgi:alkylmercury lyase
MDSATQQLTSRFVHSLSHAPGLQLWLVRPLQSLLAGGEPVTVARLAAHVGRAEAEIRQALAAMPDTEYDVEGRIIGFGLTFNPTPHRYETGGRTLYAWCAMDTLTFPAILGHTARVTSPCRATGEPVRLTVTPDKVTSVEPGGAVVSLPTPDAPTSVRVSYCNQSHFFAGPDVAHAWLAQHPEAGVLPLSDIDELRHSVVELIISADTSIGRC